MSDIAATVRATLDELGADYEIIAIDPDYADTAAFCERYGFGMDVSANAIVIASKRPPGHHSACLALATTRLDVNHRVRDLMGVKKLSFASSEVTMELTGMMIGGVTPFALPPDLPVYVDAAVRAVPHLIVGGGDRATKVLVDPEVFDRMDQVEVVEGLAQPFDA
jgi:prolyl-tRNA editing enzyme YbaK/EbsC (Cys-tRNA(Pro) deacylase)